MSSPYLPQRCILAAAVLFSTANALFSALPPEKVHPAITFKAEPFDLPDVTLLDSPFRNAMLKDKAYILSLDADRLLHTFRVTAGLPSSAKPLGGWEKPNGELRGHTMGHYLSACALMYAATGDEAIKSKADYIVAELAKCQEALPKQGYHKGFLSAYPESFFDRVDTGKPVWAPYYTLHKIMAGLLDMYVHCGNQQALQVLENMADWLKFRVDRLPVAQMQKALNVEHGGMNEVLANLYAITGNPDHLALARAFNHQAVFAPLAKGVDALDRLHANTQIPKIIGAAREYELTGEQPFHDIASFFWKEVALKRSYVIGGDSDNEHFFPITDFSRHLSDATAETCNSYNMLKLTRHLFEWNPDAQQMDFYERALYNHILASQEPGTGMVTYFMSLKPGHYKTYSTPENSFWCCLGTGMENHAKYGDTIYFHSGNDALFVNLFIPSELHWKDNGLTIRQDTSFPQTDTTSFTIRAAQPKRLALKIRRPAWAGDGFSISVNGKPQETASSTPESYVTVDRIWSDGDTVKVHLPMTLHTEKLPNDPTRVAVMYGPLVLAGELGKEGMGQLEVKDQVDSFKNVDPSVPVFVTDGKDLLSHIAPVNGVPLTFETKNLAQPHDVQLVPFYQVHGERYSVYWQLKTKAEWEKAQAKQPGTAAR